MPNAVKSFASVYVPSQADLRRSAKCLRSAPLRLSRPMRRSAPMRRSTVTATTAVRRSAERRSLIARRSGRLRRPHSRRLELENRWKPNGSCISRSPEGRPSGREKRPPKIRPKMLAASALDHRVTIRRRPATTPEPLTLQPVRPGSPRPLPAPPRAPANLKGLAGPNHRKKHTMSRSCASFQLQTTVGVPTREAMESRTCLPRRVGSACRRATGRI